jgi:hypothetical protein
MAKYDLKIKDKNNKKKYKIYIAKNKDTISLMMDYFKKFIKNKNIKKIAIDLEFNKVSKMDRSVALIQLNLEIKNKGSIFILDPTLLTTEEINILIDLLTHESIIKIIHGGESLDIPYLINQLLNNNIILIKKFLNNLYDTKYLCEYKHIIENIKNKCSIYDLYKELNIIDKTIFEFLNNIENIMGPIYLVEINIETLEGKLLEYVIYDVLYLVTLYEKLIIISNNFKYLIPEISQHIFFYKRIDDNNFKKINELVNTHNNYFFKINYTKIKLLDYYYYVLYSLEDNIYEELLNITYFKFFIEILYKYLVYQDLYKKFKIYKNNTEINSTIIYNLDLKIIFSDNIKNIIEKLKKQLIKFI